MDLNYTVSIRRTAAEPKACLVWINFDRHALLNLFQRALGTFVADADEIRPQYSNVGNGTAVFQSSVVRDLGPSISQTIDQLDQITITNTGSDKELATPWYSDQILPFDITLTGANEYGAMCAAKIFGVELLNEGTGISIDDAVTEASATFVARAVEPMSAQPSPFQTTDFRLSPCFGTIEIGYRLRAVCSEIDACSKHFRPYAPGHDFPLRPCSRSRTHKNRATASKTAPRALNPVPENCATPHWDGSCICLYLGYGCLYMSRKSGRHRYTFYCGGHHIPSIPTHFNLLSIMNRGPNKNYDGAVSLRLSPAQIDVLAPGIQLLVYSYRTRLRLGASPLAYPFRIYPPPTGFNRGCFDQSFMDGIVSLANDVQTKHKSGRRLKLDTLQIRAAAFAIRAYVDYLRLLMRKQRLKECRDEGRNALDKISIAKWKARSNRLIRSLERHMKRANRALIKTVGKTRYATVIKTWNAHLRWMRLHIAYFRPWAKPNSGRLARLRRDLDELMEIAKLGLREEGYQPPDDKELRHLMRLYARYARQGRIGMWIVGFLHEDKERFLRKYHLAQFVINRSNLKELSKS